MAWTKKDSNPRKIVSGFLNDAAVKNIMKLESKGFFDDVIGVENEGKESVIIRVVKELWKNGSDKENTGKNENKTNKEKENKIEYRVLKVHRIEANKFQRVHQYILGDPRFSGIKMERRSIVFNWTKKEFSNLKRAYEAKVSCPEPYAFLDNMVVMSAILDKDGLVSKKLKDTEIENHKFAEKLFDKILAEYKKLYQGAKIVHADFSEFNILLQDSKKPYIIDFAQGVHIDHPKSEEFLLRDIHNLCRFFRKNGLKKDENECISFVKNSSADRSGLSNQD